MGVSLMDTERFVFIDKVLAAFDFGTFQDFFTLLLLIDRNVIIMVVQR